MAEMRPAGLTEDGTALRLSDQDGGEHTLPLTDEVRSLVAGDSGTDSPAPAQDEDAEKAAEAQEGSEQDTRGSSSSASSAPSSGTTTAPASASTGTSAPARQVSPREIQTRIRAGATAEQVAEATGASLARVRVFEYPVLAERAWVAQQVQQLEVWVGGPDLYSSTVEDGGPSTLGELVSHRLQELGVDADAVTWDAWREGPGPWTVVADFGLEGMRSKPTQEQPPARFAFRQGAKHVDHVNRWAQLLADAETWNISSGGAKEDETPFDVEAGDEAERPAAEPTALHPDTAPDPDEELLDILRARRGRRLGTDEESDDALALMLTRDETPIPQQPAKPTLAAADDTGAGSAASADQTEYLWDDEDGGDDGALASVHAFRTADAATGDADDADQTDDDTGQAEGAGDARQDSDDDAARQDSGDDADRGDDRQAAETGAAESTAPESTGPTRADAPATHEADAGQDTAAESADQDAGEDEDTAATGRTQPTAGRGTSRGRIADVLIKDTSAPKPGAEKKTTRSKSTNRRASVPSWDEIVFGRKND